MREIIRKEDKFTLRINDDGIEISTEDFMVDGKIFKNGWEHFFTWKRIAYELSEL